MQDTRNKLKTQILLFGVARYHPHPKFLPYPAKHVSIRGAEDDKYTLVDISKEEPKILEEIEFSRALFEVYEGGVVCLFHLIRTTCRHSYMPYTVVHASRANVHRESG